MPTLIAGVVAVAVIYTLLQMFRSTSPALLARGVKIGGGVVCVAAAVFTGVKGELAVAIPLGLFGAGLLGWSPAAGNLFSFGRGGGRSKRQVSQVRSDFVEMTLDHDTGAMSGQFTAGTHAGRSLDTFDLAQLAAMMPGLDGETGALLEAYMDRRFSGWRENAQGQGAGRKTGQPASGKMTAEEAYQILGLPPGAGREDIGRAHRSLMKKLHPDQGGSTYLAARVNEAKDTLLRTHHN